MAKLRRGPRVADIIGDQCRYGLRAKGPSGTWRPARKPTRFLSSSEEILDKLSLRCRGVHLHQTLLGGGRASAAAIYPPGLRKAILEGTEAQLRRDRGALTASVQKAVDDGTGLYDLDSSPATRLPTSDSLGAITGEGCMVPEAGEVTSRTRETRCRSMPAIFREWAAMWSYLGDMSGEGLPADGVKTARAEEVAFMESWGCWERVRGTRRCDVEGESRLRPGGWT